MTNSRNTPGSAGREPSRKGQQRPVRRASQARSGPVPTRRSGTSARARSARLGVTTKAARSTDPRGRLSAHGEGAPTDKRRRASAGRIIAVGLVCFGVWLFFDANQLYHSAEAGQIGVRRSVAMSLLRPIAAFAGAIGFSGPVNAADSALGRCGIGGAPACDTGPLTTVVPVVAPLPRPVGYLGLGAAPHLGPGVHYIPPPPPPVVPAGPPPLVSPTPSRPMTLLSIGDSVGEDLGFGLGDVFSQDLAVRVVQKGLEDTGLARIDYYNWPVTLETELRRYHPEIVVVMLGANDMQSFSVGNGRYLLFSMASATWWRAYAARVALVMEEATSAGAHVMWVGLPPMGAASTVPAGFPQKLDRVFLIEARRHPGVTYYPSDKVLATRRGGFIMWLSVNGSYEQIRSSDGVHLLPAGYDLLAKALVQPMERAWNVNLHL